MQGEVRHFWPSAVTERSGKSRLLEKVTPELDLKEQVGYVIWGSPCILEPVTKLGSETKQKCTVYMLLEEGLDFRGSQGLG